MLTKFIFIIKESFRGFSKAFTLLLISSFSISISLVVFSILLYSYSAFAEYVNVYNDQFNIEVFFSPDLNESEANSIFENILSFSEIQGGEFINKDKASKIFYKYFDADIEKLLGSNPLPMGAKYFINDNYQSDNQISELVDKISSFSNIDKVLFDNSLVIKSYKLFDKIFIILGFVGAGVVFISIILVSNTIRLMINSKKDEIRIMELLGMKKYMIKLPFLIEGLLQGILGALLAIIFLSFCIQIIEYLFYPFILIDKNINSLLLVFLLNLICGLSLGFVGSKNAISKFL